MLIPHPQIHSLMKSFGSTVCAKNVNIPSPKSQSPKKEPAPKARRPLLNWGPAALPHASEIFEEEHVGTRRSSLSKPDTCDKPPEAAFYVFRFATPRAGTPLVPTSPRLPGADRGKYSSRYRQVVTETEQETFIAAAERPYRRRQRNLEL
jgi:hypothetical protein